MAMRVRVSVVLLAPKGRIGFFHLNQWSIRRERRACQCELLHLGDENNGMLPLTSLFPMCRRRSKCCSSSSTLDMNNGLSPRWEARPTVLRY